MKLSLTDALAGKIDDQINLALCEWLGWKYVPPNRSWPNPHWTDPVSHVLRTLAELPNHITAPESLGLVHEVEEKMTSEQAFKYTWLLREITRKNQHAHHLQVAEWEWHATARQRVIAILQTVKPEIFES